MPNRPINNNLDQKHKFYGLSQILLNEDYFNNIVKALVNRGDSILIKNDPVEDRELKESAKDLSQFSNSYQKK